MNGAGDYVVASILKFYEAPYSDPVREWLDVVTNINGANGSMPALFTANDGKVAVAISDNQDVMVAWTRRVSPDSVQILTSLYSAGSWGPESLQASESQPIGFFDLAADGNGNFTLVWIPADRTLVWAKRFNAGSWGVRELIDQSANTTFGERSVQVGMYGTGKAIVVWNHAFLTSFGIRTRQFDGTNWQYPITLDTAGSDSPQLAVQEDGRAMVVFRDTGRVVASYFNGSTWDKAISVSCGTGEEYPSDVDMDGFGNAVIAIQTDCNNRGCGYLRTYEAGRGWLDCSGVVPSWYMGPFVVARTHHQILGVGVTANNYIELIWSNKEVYINGYEEQTDSAIVNLSVELPHNNICGEFAPYLFEQMRFSNNGTNWSSWEPAPVASPYKMTRSGWDLTQMSYGGTTDLGLKRVYVQFRNAYCESLVAADEIEYTTTRPPDLVVSSLSGPWSSVGRGLTITLRDATRNIGTVASPVSTTKFFISPSPTLASSYSLLGSRPISTLAEGIADQGSTSVRIPANLSAGNYYLVAQADANGVVAEADEGNNLTAFPISITSGAPDLIVSTLTPPYSASPGTTMTVANTVKNQGTATAGASSVHFYLSSDYRWDPADRYIGTRTIPDLAPNGTSSSNTSLSIPADAAAYYIIARADPSGYVVESNESNNDTPKVIRIGPDLVVSGLTVPVSAASGATITVTDTIKNQGNAGAGASITRFYFSTNIIWDYADTPLNHREVLSLAANGTNSANTTITMPTGLATGTYYVIAKADGGGWVPESIETNNTKYAAVQVGPDLIVSGFKGPASATSGAAITVTDQIKNQGSASAGTSITRFYFSTNSTWDANDQPLGSRPVLGLAANGTDSASTALNIPPNLQAGTYYLIAKADADGQVPEANETNNTRYATVGVGPDLVVSELKSPRLSPPGLEVWGLVKNQGVVGAGATSARIYFSLNTSLDASDTPLGLSDVPPLSPNGTSGIQFKVTIPTGLSSGTYYLIAKVDPDNEDVVESNESNNTRYVGVPVGADLVVGGFSGSSIATPGAPYVISDDTGNKGTAGAGASITRFYFSRNTLLDSTDTPLGSRNVPALASLGIDSGNTILTIPMGLATGNYYILIKADADGTVPEAIENNNTAYRLVGIGPDLVISALTVPASTAPGATITVTDTTLNQGTTVAASSIIRHYLSTNYLLDSADIPLGYHHVKDLLPDGGNFSASTTLTIPAGLASGTYYIIAKADADNAVVETIENNNGSVADIRIGADLVVSGLTISKSSVSWAPITITDTTKNQGTSDAAASTTRFYFSTNNLLDGADTLIGSRSVPALKATTASSASTNLSIPAGLAVGTYYIIAKADADVTVPETIETNNTKYAVIQVGPDLVVTALEAPPGVLRGEHAVSVTVTTQNRGFSQAAASTTTCYVSLDNSFGKGDIPIASLAVPSLAAGAGSRGTVTGTVPTTIAAGTYYLIAVADATGIVQETNETNDTISKVFVVQ